MPLIWHKSFLKLKSEFDTFKTNVSVNMDKETNELRSNISSMASKILSLEKLNNNISTKISSLERENRDLQNQLKSKKGMIAFYVEENTK